MRWTPRIVQKSTVFDVAAVVPDIWNANRDVCKDQSAPSLARNSLNIFPIHTQSSSLSGDP